MFEFDTQAKIGFLYCSVHVFVQFPSVVDLPCLTNLGFERRSHWTRRLMIDIKGIPYGMWSRDYYRDH